MKLSSAVEMSRHWKAYLLSRYWSFSDQERLSVNVLGIFLFVTVCYLAIWQPLTRAADNAKQTYRNQAELVTWIKANEAEFKKLTDSGAQGQRAGQSLMTLVTDAAQKNQLALTRFEPTSNEGLHIWLEDIPFNKLLSWLDQLDAQGVVLDNLQLEHQSASGQVNVVLTLK